MSKLKSKTILSFIFVIGSILFIILGTIYLKSKVLHPDAVATVFNQTTNKKTQAYALKDLQVYIDETYRMDMGLWSYYVKAEGEAYDPDFNTIKEGVNENLALTKENANNDKNPFIVKLKIKNLNTEAKNIDFNNFKLRDVNNKEYSPSTGWQETLADAGFFAGAKNQMQLNPNEEKVLWLVFGTPSKTTIDNSIYQEFIQINIDSSNSLFSTKYEIPFNLTVNYPINDSKIILNQSIEKLTILYLFFIACCGAMYFKNSSH